MMVFLRAGMRFLARGLVFGADRIVASCGVQTASTGVRRVYARCARPLGQEPNPRRAMGTA